MPVDRLSEEDRLVLWPDPVWPQDIGALAVLDGTPLLDPDGRFRLETARAAIGGRLHQVPGFRRVLRVPRKGLGGPLWVDAPTFDLTEHVRVFPVPAPGDEAQLLRSVQELRRRRLDPSRPLWEMWWLPGLADGRVGLFIRMHHVLADGIAGVATLAAFLDPRPDVPVAPGPPWHPAPAPTTRALLADALRRRIDTGRRALAPVAHPRTAVGRLRAAWPALRELVTDDGATVTSLNRMVGGERTLALVRGRMDVVRAIAHRHGGTVNDVLLAVTAGGLRALLGSRGELTDDLVVRVEVPVTLRPADQRARARGNLIGQMVVPLPVGMSDPARRLERIAAETARRKTRSRLSLGTMMRRRVARMAVLRIMARHPVNVMTADVPGPPQPVHVAGARVTEVFPLLNLIGNQCLGVGALSYAGRFGVMAVADGDAVPDLGVFAAGAQGELDALASPRTATAGRWA
jgi:WS/DGAT/MGAT family acyltransferase